MGRTESAELCRIDVSMEKKLSLSLSYRMNTVVASIAFAPSGKKNEPSTFLPSQFRWDSPNLAMY